MASVSLLTKFWTVLSPPPAAEPEARGAAAGRSAGKARRPASLRGGGGGPAAGTAGPPAPGCAPALPDWLAARTRPPELARPPALRRPRRAGGARGGGDATRDELIAGGRAWWWWGAETTPPPGPCRPRGADLSPRRRPAPGDWRSCTYASGARSGLQPRRVPCAPPRARGALARPSSPRAVPRAHHAPLLPPGLGRLRSIHIVALGNEGDAFHQDSRPSGLIRAYLGRSPLVSGDESSLLLSASGAAARPVFTEYQASAFGNVKLVVHDCPVWVRGLTELSFSFFSPPASPFMNVNVRVTGGEFSFFFFSFFFFLTFWGKSLVLRFRGRGQPNQRTLLEGKKKSPSENVKHLGVRFTIVGCLLVKTADP